MNERFESPLSSAINYIISANGKQGYARLFDLQQVAKIIDGEIKSLDKNKSKYPIGEHTD